MQHTTTNNKEGEMTTVKNIATKYYGIWIVAADGQYWLSADNGSDKYFGDVVPTRDDIDHFRTQLLRNGRP